jgi:hypothetical protein
MRKIIRPQLERFQFGRFEITTFMDGAHIRNEINPPFVMDKTPEEIARIAAVNNIFDYQFENTYSPTLLNLDGKLVLIDTGFGQLLNDGTAGYLLQLLIDSGYRAEDIDYVVFTHCHPDHIGGFITDGSLTFPNAKYCIGRVEFDAWLSGNLIPPSRSIMSVFGFFIGLLSAIMGIGGGALSTIYLSLYNVSIHRAVSTSAAVGAIISVPGTVGYIVAGLWVDGLPPGNLGFVSILTFIIFIPTSLVTTKFGVKLAHKLSKRSLEMLFGSFLLCVSFRFFNAILL